MKMNFRNIAFVLLSIVIFHAPLSYGAGAEDKKAEVAQYHLDSLRTRLDIEVEVLESFAYKKVFSCNLYQVTPWMKSSDGSKESSGSYVVVETGDSYAPLVSPKNDEGNSQLITCFNDDFVVNSEEDAMTLLHALGSVTGDGVTTEDKVLKSADGWQLATGTFFDNFSGYQVKTDSAGKVLLIDYALELPAI
ncbi:MAG: hypothetical protein DRR11_08875 [Gammaproteobacteria bacterium]|nr:MAG: hypothetical protein DRR11_08875 [Gammaproteobacteria bacterium]RLA34923.1 MAG: hypothetical protein DRR15_08305 [Gammaproteobacteria bacterium]